jgi:hypothetical protein
MHIPHTNVRHYHNTSLFVDTSAQDVYNCGIVHWNVHRLPSLARLLGHMWKQIYISPSQFKNPTRYGEKNGPKYGLHVLRVVCKDQKKQDRLMHRSCLSVYLLLCVGADILMIAYDAQCTQGYKLTPRSAYFKQRKKPPWLLVHKRTVPTERQPPVDEI